MKVSKCWQSPLLALSLFCSLWVWSSRLTLFFSEDCFCNLWLFKSRWCDHSYRARHPGMWSQVGLRKHHYKQRQWRWWNSSWAFSNPERWCCEIAALNMPANLENSSGDRTENGQFSFQSQRKAMPTNTQTTTQLHLSHLLVKNAQNSPSQASAIRVSWTSRCSSWF